MTKLWKLDLDDGDVESEHQKKVVHVSASGQYSYAVVEREGANNEVYSWGMGENYVLGNRDDNNEFFPYVLHPKMFEEKNPI